MITVVRYLRNSIWFIIFLSKSIVKRNRLWRLFLIVSALVLLLVLALGVLIVGIRMSDLAATNLEGNQRLFFGISENKLFGRLLENVAAGLFSALTAVLTIELVRDYLAAVKSIRTLILIVQSDYTRDNTQQIETMKLNGWLYDYTFFRKQLARTNMRDQKLNGGVMPFCDFSGANFVESDLRNADLRCSNLTDAKFDRAVLNECDLRGCKILRVNKQMLKNLGAIVDDP